MTTPAAMTSTAIGRPHDRIDGRLKVTGAARYTAEIDLPGLVHAVIVGATVPSGRVVGIEAGAALAQEDVLAVLTHRNIGRISGQPRLLPSLVGGPSPGQSFFPMQDEKVHYAGQPVAIVVARSIEGAQYGASLVTVTYEVDEAVTTIEEGRDAAFEPDRLFGGLMPARMKRGDVDSALAAAEARVDVTHTFAANNHNPLEPSATTASWEDGALTLYDSTMSIRSTQLTVSHILGIPMSDVRVIGRFVGGAFGSKAMTWPHVTLAAMAALKVGRPVRLSLTRPQTFTSHGHREEQEQRITLGATREGRLTAIRHTKLSVGSPFDDWAEPATGVSSQMYACENFQGVHNLIRGNTMTPTFTRGPGETLGVFTLETAMDELAYELGMDPIELRVLNHADVDAMGHPWSSDGLVPCLRRGADLFGWRGRNPRPRAHRDGDWLIGTGVAAAGYPVAFFMPTQRARARLYSDGSATVATGTPEFGTGIMTVMAQIAADVLGLPVGAVRPEIGDTDLPNTSAPVGSSGAFMISSAVYAAVANLREKLVRTAVADNASPLHGADPASVRVERGRMMLRDRPNTSESYGDLMARHRLADVEALGSWTPPSPETPHGLLTFGAQFAEVAVDPELGLTRVRRMLGVFAPGRVLNPKLARSQLMGGMLWGLGQALLEGNHMEPQHGRWAAGNLAEYLVPVNADAPEVTVEFVEVEDALTGPLGAKGVGEIGQVGANAAIANAVYHATGRRVRRLPITPEVIMDPPSA